MTALIVTNDAGLAGRAGRVLDSEDHSLCTSKGIRKWLSKCKVKLSSLFSCFINEMKSLSLSEKEFHYRTMAHRPRSSLAAFVALDASFDGLGSCTLSTRKLRNTEAATRWLFGPNLVKLYPGRFDTELAHKIHVIIAGRGLIDRAGRVLDSEDQSEFVSDGNRFKPMSKQEVKKQLNALFSLCSCFINKRKSLDSAEKLRTAAYFLHRFLAIHPYCDGNGRVARLLTSLLLMRLGAAAHPVCFNLRPENRQRYIAGLNVQGDVTGPESEQLGALAQLLEEAVRDTSVTL